MRLEGKVAIITGSSKGIGKATALLMAKEGAAVVINGRDNRAVEETLLAVQQIGGRAIGCRGDVSDETQVDGIVSRALEAFGKIDILVNNAGVTGASKWIHETDQSQWDSIIANNLKSTFLCCRAVLRHMIPNARGVIVNFGSTAGKEGSPGLAPYAAAKAGIICLTKTLSWEVAQYGIRVNCVVPGLIDTSMGTSHNSERYEYFKNKAALKRSGKPEEVAEAVLFLASDDSSFITGQCLNVCGGRLSY